MIKVKNRLWIGYTALIVLTSIGCSKSGDAPATPSTGGGTVTLGPLFTAAKVVIQSKCAISGCHVNPSNTGGVNFETDNNIAARAARIKQRAVIDGTMPPTGSLTQNEKDKLKAWVDAGGRITD